MSDENHFEFMGDYISIVVTGLDSFQRSAALWKQIAEVCDKYHCYNILGQSRTGGEMSTMDSFNHIDIFQDAGISWKHRIAWVADDPVKYEQLKFIETVLRNRALLNGRLFHSVEEARHWLLKDSAEEATAHKASVRPGSA